MLLHCNNYAFAKTPKTPSYPPVRGRLDTETSLEEETQAEKVSSLPLTGG